MKELLKQKTTVTAIVGLVTTVGAVLTGDMEVGQAIQAGFALLMTIFMRQGIEKNK
ncbi:MAG: hypothetical protein GY861_24355 [bacterium]|nr:hypothetical protein [bacterium]